MDSKKLEISSPEDTKALEEECRWFEKIATSSLGQITEEEASLFLAHLDRCQRHRDEYQETTKVVDGRMEEFKRELQRLGVISFVETANKLVKEKISWDDLNPHTKGTKQFH